MDGPPLPDRQHDPPLLAGAGETLGPAQPSGLGLDLDLGGLRKRRNAIEQPVDFFNRRVMA
jgi:hypothetical protein